MKILKNKVKFQYFVFVPLPKNHGLDKICDYAWPHQFHVKTRKISMGPGTHSHGFASNFPDMLGTKQKQIIEVHFFQNMHGCHGNHK